MLFEHSGGLSQNFGTSSPGHEYLINDAGLISGAWVDNAANHRGQHSLSSPAAPAAPLTPPAPTLVGTSSGLEIDLIWDSSVATAPNGFTQAIVDAAKYYTSLFSTKEVININVGWNEIAGSALSSGALGESESYGYLTNYATVAHALEQDGYSFTASNEPTKSQFFVTSAEAKGLGLANGTTVGSASLDGFIGFGSLSGSGDAWNLHGSTTGSNTGTGANQFDLEAVALHEISEIMGRIGIEGERVNGKSTYTPLDLFDFNRPGVLELSGNGGYFSVNDGATNLGTYNKASTNGGDIADWASAKSISQSGTQGLMSGDFDTYDAFSPPGYNGAVSQSDVIEEAALGFGLTLAGREFV